MNAKVIREFRVGKNIFEINDIIKIEDESVLINGSWFCDVESEFFVRHFKLID